ncbi:putative thioesterase [Calothrix parasitica NIES-267]|uniref:Putative thioesterase n=1 Tax=Calothrix parasitica NIES-267 TaxID=1973488 RepID=A0A1Z4LTA3_9CYAN|nr:putative thioesterase [Calothrix parasitica NIES-267]
MTAISAFNSWINFPKSNPKAKLRLFCFHYAGGGASSFRSWIDKLPSEVEVCLIELPGRGMRMMEPPFTQLQLLIDALEKALLPSFDRPFIFFGHSMGALVSFELTQTIFTNHKLLPLHLYVSGQRAPHIPDPDPPIHHLPEALFLKELRRYNGTPEEVLNNSELMQLLLPTLRADFAVLENYVYTPSPPLNCPITAFGGLEDWKANYEQLRSWETQTNSTFSIQLFPGDHFFIYSSESKLLQYLGRELNQIARKID